MLGIEVQGLIVPIEINNNAKVLEIKETLLQRGYAIGAIRQPTVKSAILRVIARLGENAQTLENLCRCIDKLVLK